MGDLDIDGIEEMSPADKQTLRKKLSSEMLAMVARRLSARRR